MLGPHLNVVGDGVAGVSPASRYWRAGAFHYPRHAYLEGRTLFQHGEAEVGVSRCCRWFHDHRRVQAHRAIGTPLPGQSRAHGPSASEHQVSWYQHTLKYLARRRGGLSGSSLRSIAETLTTVTLELLIPGEGPSDDALLRQALYGWAYRGRTDPPADRASALDWIAARSGRRRDPTHQSRPEARPYGCQSQCRVPRSATPYGAYVRARLTGRRGSMVWP